MNESLAMQEIRAIRNENSERHLKMSFEELKKEENEALKWLEAKLGKSFKVVSPARKA